MSKLEILEKKVDSNNRRFDETSHFGYRSGFNAGMRQNGNRGRGYPSNTRGNYQRNRGNYRDTLPSRPAAAGRGNPNEGNDTPITPKE